MIMAAMRSDRYVHNLFEPCPSCFATSAAAMFGRSASLVVPGANLCSISYSCWTDSMDSVLVTSLLFGLSSSKV